MKRLAFTLIFVLSACSAIEEKVTPLTTASVISTGTTYSCAYYSEYDTLSDCQNSTLANCQYQWETYPGGGTNLCYYPVAGWESCAVTPVDWVYTPYSSIQCRVSGSIYKVARSVVGCSSTTCACLGPQLLTTTCTYGTNCPATVPAPPVDPAPPAEPFTPTCL